MVTPILDSTRWWWCPLQCPTHRKTTEPGVITPMHQCPERGGLDVPLQQGNRYGLKKRNHVELVSRGDYMNGALWHRDDTGRRGIMAAHLHRPDGSFDTTVFAPAAGAVGRGENT